ncbi:MAG TPA: DUF416 family protein [Flavitalea sp.]|nr:DUF416 family protein [Flavitalea sp.]HTF27670.1 DUF416 family protein [Flavitalea sp.]
MAIEEVDKLKQLDFTKQAAFNYLTCERLYPNYVYFSDNFDFGNPDALRIAIDYLYLNIFEKGPDKNKIKNLAKEVDKNTPDTENFTTTFVSSALDACTAIGDSLNFLIQRNFLSIKNISTYATDTVSMYIQETESLDFSKDNDFKKKIDKHPLMQKEIAMQSGIISFLTNSKGFDFGDLQILLHLQENNKKSNLNL